MFVGSIDLCLFPLLSLHFIWFNADAHAHDVAKVRKIGDPRKFVLTNDTHCDSEAVIESAPKDAVSKTIRISSMFDFRL